MAHLASGDELGELHDAQFGAWLESALGSAIDGCDGLFVATQTAGASESVGFWSEVTERGARLANPRTFPWTLASAPAAHLAMQCGVRGPVVNFVGGADAAAAAIESALDHLDDGVVERAAVVALDRMDGRTQAAVLVVDGAVRTGMRPDGCVIGVEGAVDHLVAVHAAANLLSIG